MPGLDVPQMHTYAHGPSSQDLFERRKSNHPGAQMPAKSGLGTGLLAL